LFLFDNSLIQNMTLKWLYAVVAVAALAGGYFFIRHFWRPYGHREAYLRIVDSTLQNYAHDHGGWFPVGDDSFQSLQSLYPEYFGSGVELAGLTGDIKAVSAALQNQQSISNLTSWSYVPNLRIDDDPQLAILWESKFGLSAAGRTILSDRRPVLLVNQAITNVSREDWPSFWEYQKQLQRIAASKREVPRAGESNSTRASRPFEP